MNNILRQISEIISQAESINVGNAKSTVATFSKFNDEMKSYLLANTENETVIKLLNDIPNLHEEMQEDKSINSFLVGLFTNGESSYLQTAEESEKTIMKISDIKGKYSSIKAILKNSQ